MLQTAGLPGLGAERLEVPDHDFDEPLSPELVLVSPELRDLVSPDEPDARSAQPEDVAAPATAPAPPAVPIAPPSAETPAAPQKPPTAPPLTPPSTQTSAARVEWRLTVGAATVLALCAVLVFGAGVAVGQLALPTSTPPPSIPASSHQGTASAPTTALPAPKTKAPVPRSVLPIPSSTAAPTATRERRSSPVPANPAKKRPSRTVRPVPNGGYAFFDGSFQLSGDARSVVHFTVRTSCAGPLVLHPVRVTRAGTFSFSGHPAGSLPGTIVHLSGRFVSPAVARGTLQVTRPACHDTATPFVAHLS